MKITSDKDFYSRYYINAHQVRLVPAIRRYVLKLFFPDAMLTCVFLKQKIRPFVGKMSNKLADEYTRTQ